MTQARPIRHTRAASLLERPALEARLDSAFGKRLTTIVAGAGFGKTTLLTQWSRDVASAWFTAGPEDSRLGSLASGLSRSLRAFIGGLTVGRGSRLAAPDEAMRADAIAAYFATELELRLEHDLVLVVDDVHELAGSPSARLVEGLVRQAPVLLHIVLSGRTDPPFRIQRLRGQGQVLELDAGDLSFDEHETAALLEQSLGTDARVLASRIHDLTEGWPAAVRLAIEVVDRVDPAERETAVDGLRGSSGPLLGYLAEEVFEQEEQPVRDLIRAVAPFERFTPELCEALGLVDSRLAIDSLRRKGLFLTPQRADGGFLVLHSLVREYALDRLPLGDDELRPLHRRSAEWFEANDQLAEALGSYVQGGDANALADFLARRGEELLAHGSIDPVVEAGHLLPAGSRDASLEEILG
ncbi:MAG TPA: hypothetical protein VFR32_03775, partial [Gaiellaceae bacterium]|nr:hypothetical protein [Gaiellaceae bacterium]